jgi:hypothetical protein
MSGDAVLTRVVGDAEERRESGVGVGERGVHLVAHHHGVVAGGQLGDGGQLGRAVHETQRIVRIAEQERPGARRERLLDPVEVEGPSCAFVEAERNLLDDSAGLRHHAEERGIDGRGDDDAVARADGKSQRFDDDDAHVRRRRDALRVHPPAPRGRCVGGESALHTVVGADVAGVGAAHGVDESGGDRLGERVVHLGDEEREHVVGVCPPLLARARTELLQGVGRDRHGPTLPVSARRRIHVALA